MSSIVTQITEGRFNNLLKMASFGSAHRLQMTVEVPAGATSRNQQAHLMDWKNVSVDRVRAEILEGWKVVGVGVILAASGELVRGVGLADRAGRSYADPKRKEPLWMANSPHRTDPEKEAANGHYRSAQNLRRRVSQQRVAARRHPVPINRPDAKHN